MPALAAAVLAAGGSTRFGSPKLLAPLDGRPVVRWAVDAAVDAGIGPVFVVEGAVALAAVMPPEVIVLQNHEWADGIATSLAVAIDEAERRRCEAVVVSLGDSPGVPAEAWRRVATSSAPIAVATYAGARHHPVRLHQSVWPLLPRTGDRGAGAVMRERPDLVVEVACDGDPRDIDTVEDLSQWS